jgi:membrane-bound lytic murein transglycosylase B
VARHRLPSRKTELASALRSARALIARSSKPFEAAAIRRRVMAMAQAPAVSVAVITPLVCASAVSGQAHHIPARTADATAVAPVMDAVASSASVSLPGPSVIAAVRAPSNLHIRTVPPKIAALPPATNHAGALGIPSMALAAYRNAEDKIAVSDPGCGISWNLLAGIGRIESGHAGGGAIDAHGTAIHPIYGPALDGSLRGNEVIVQTTAAGGSTFARAMGPMQFLPDTWARYAADGNGDGIADPQNLYDASLAAARYLCGGGLNLRDPPQMTSAVMHYNNSAPYARNVLGWAAAYATGVVPVDLPPVSGPAPPIADPHLEHPEGLGPGLPLNIHGLPSADPLAQQPLIDFGPPVIPAPQQLIWPPQPVVPDTPGCTVICIGQ